MSKVLKTNKRVLAPINTRKIKSFDISKKTFESQKQKIITVEQKPVYKITKKTEQIINGHRALILITERYRSEQQIEILKELPTYLQNKNISYTILVIHQNNNNLFNKGALYNIGYKYAKESNISFDYVILHDIDMIPIEYDYSYTRGACFLYGLILNYGKNKETFTSTERMPFAGGVTTIDTWCYESINGFSNMFEGWGGEDDYFLIKIDKNNITKTSKYGIFRSWPNPRSESNPVFGNNTIQCFTLNPTDGLNTINFVKSIKNMQTSQNNFPTRIISYKKDVKYENIYHCYVDFPSRFANKIDISPHKLNSLNMKSSNKLIVSFINGSQYYSDLFSEIFNKIFSNCTIEYNTSNPKFESDILIDSCYGEEEPTMVHYNCYKIYMKGKSKKIYNVQYYDLVIDSVNKTLIESTKIIYMPNYAYSMYERKIHTSKDLLNTKLQNKTEFCGYLYNTCDENRELFFNILNKYKPITVLGKCKKKIINGKCANVTTDRWTYNDDNTYNDLAIEKYSKCKFAIIFERKNEEGYITEKIINAMLAKSIPIYYGTNKIKDHFNPDSFVYVNDFNTFEDCIEYIKKIDNDDDLYTKYIDSPYFVGNILNKYLSNDYIIKEIETIMKPTLVL